MEREGLYKLVLDGLGSFWTTFGGVLGRVSAPLNYTELIPRYDLAANEENLAPRPA